MAFISFHGINIRRRKVIEQEVNAPSLQEVKYVCIDHEVRHPRCVYN